MKLAIAGDSAGEGLARILAEISFDKKDYRYAFVLFEEIARRSPPGARERFMTGVCRLDRKDYAAAKVDLQAAIEAGLNDADRTAAQAALDSIPSEAN